MIENKSNTNTTTITITVVTTPETTLKELRAHLFECVANINIGYMSPIKRQAKSVQSGSITISTDD